MSQSAWSDFIDGSYGPVFASAEEFASAAYGLFSLSDEGLSSIVEGAKLRLEERPDSSLVKVAIQPRAIDVLICIAIFCIDRAAEEQFSPSNLALLSEKYDWEALRSRTQQALDQALRLSPRVRAYFSIADRPNLLSSTKLQYSVHLHSEESADDTQIADVISVPVATLILWKDPEGEAFQFDITERTLTLLRDSLDKAQIRLARIRESIPNAAQSSSY